MLSYQHSYHAGNKADIHKHGILCAVLEYLLQKDKPLSYIETHAGRGLYDLKSVEAQKTGEAEAGALAFFDQYISKPENTYVKLLQKIREEYGPDFYPGSPMVAAKMLRESDVIHLAERHPQEVRALKNFLPFPNVKIHDKDGFKMVKGLLPPNPRRGILLIDPSYEIKSEYEELPDFIAAMHQKWPVGIIMLWYPILSPSRHEIMLQNLEDKNFESIYRHELFFDQVKKPHRLIGSGMFMINPPYQIQQKAKDIEGLLKFL